MKNHSTWVSILCVIVGFAQAWAGVDTPQDKEAEYSEAVLDYQSGDAQKALPKLEAILSDQPDNIKALELKGLVLKSAENWKDAARVFLKLRKLAKSAGVDDEKALSYEFQVGTLLVQLQKYDKAKAFLQKCFKAGFNVPVTKFYLGIIAMEEGDLRDAQSNFRSVVRSDVEGLKAPSHFYLGVISKRRKEDTAAEASWKTAKDMAETISRDPASAPATRAGAKQLLASVDALLNMPADGGQSSAVFASVGLVTGYDSNVLLNPAVDTGATGQGTPMTTFRYSLGYQAEFLGIQFMPMWQGSINYNFNSGAKAGQFFINDLNLWANRTSGHWRYGMRAGASIVLRNFVATGSTTGNLRKQSISPTFGPNVRYEWGEKTAIGSEVVVALNTFYNEESLSSELLKTGWETRWRNYYQSLDKTGWWNPTAEISLQYQYTNGIEFRSIGARTSLSTVRYWNDHWSSTLRAGLGYITYPSRSAGARNDIEINAGLGAGYELASNIRLSGDFTYLNNLSNVTDIYKYNRWVASVAGDYTF